MGLKLESTKGPVEVEAAGNATWRNQRTPLNDIAAETDSPTVRDISGDEHGVSRIIAVSSWSGCRAHGGASPAPRRSGRPYSCTCKLMHLCPRIHF